MASQGVVAIFGPFSQETIGIVKSVTTKLGIPHLIAQWIPEPAEIYELPASMTVNFYPDSNMLARSLSELIVDSDWKRYTIIYENDEGLMKLKDILQIHGPTDEPITVRQLPEGNDFRALLKEIKTNMGDILVECSVQKALPLLEQAKSLEMLAEYQRFIFTSVDTHSIHFMDMHIEKANITTMRVIDTRSFEVRSAVNDMMQYEKMQDRYTEISPDHIRTEPILVYDAVKVFTKHLLEYINGLEQELYVPAVQCNEPYPWAQGREIIQRLKHVNISGISGPIFVDDDGRRQHFNLHIVELQKTGFEKIGVWSPVDGFNYTRSAHEVMELALDGLQNKVVRVVMKMGDPFLMEKIEPEGTNLDVNNRYEGYMMDLIQELATLLNFTYQIEVVPDGKYGNYDPDIKDWNGVVKHVKDRVSSHLF